jgi:hypothetical protein
MMFFTYSKFFFRLVVKTTKVTCGSEASSTRGTNRLYVLLALISYFMTKAKRSLLMGEVRSSSDGPKTSIFGCVLLRIIRQM